MIVVTAKRKALIQFSAKGFIWFSPPSLLCLTPRPLTIWTVFSFASHREHSMRMFIWLTLLGLQWRVLDTAQWVVPSSLNQCVLGACGWQACFLGWGCILPFQGASCDGIHFILYLKPQTLNEQRIQGHWDLFLDNLSLLTPTRSWVSLPRWGVVLETK